MGKRDTLSWENAKGILGGGVSCSNSISEPVAWEAGVSGGWSQIMQGLDYRVKSPIYRQ